MRMREIVAGRAVPGTACTDATRSTDRLRPTARRCTLRIGLIGEFTVERDGALLPTTDVGSRKARTLLAFLATHRRMVSVDQIATVVWDTVPPRNPVAGVGTLVSRLRAVLGSAAVAGATDTGYRLGTTVRVDLDDAVGLVEAAEAELAVGGPELASMHAGQALALLDIEPIGSDHVFTWLDRTLLQGGEYVAAWAERIRGLHVDLLRRARHAAMEAALATGDPKRAATIAETAIRVEPLDEAAHRSFMRAADVTGEPVRALLAYQALRAALARELGVDPAPATRELYADILRRNAAT